MLKVVSNTTPLLTLLKIGRLDLLQKLCSEICIPSAVFHEIEAGKAKSYYVDLSKISWIKIIEISNPKTASYFLDLDQGEAEAIMLASEIEAELILLDEKLGRFHAKHIGLKVTGTIGILLKAKQLNFVSNIKTLLQEMQQKGIWLSEDLIAEALKIAGEK